MRSMLAIAAAMCLVGPGASAGDFDLGKRVFNKCRSCHSIGPNVRTMVGPPLNGVVGREWGAVEGFRYSSGREGTLLAIHEAEPQVWDIETLSAYLRKPKDVIPKGKMAFAGVPEDEDIENVLFYLASFDEDGNETDPAPVLEAASADADGDAEANDEGGDS